MTGFFRRSFSMASRNENATTPSRKAYQKPSLKEYGQLKNLTTGGTTGVPEGQSGHPNKKP
jgi:hypothetical protein